MIVVAIIATLAALAIVNLTQSRVRANEATALTALKNYCTAQVTFQTGRLGRVASNTSPGGDHTGYCRVFPNLFYGNPVRDSNAADLTLNISLISKAHADAYIDSLVTYSEINAAPTVPPTSPVGYQGYQFANSSDSDADPDFFLTKFSHLAVPARSGATGQNVYWVSLEGTIYYRGVPANQDAATSAAISTPDGSFSGWFNL